MKTRRHQKHHLLHRWRHSYTSGSSTSTEWYVQRANLPIVECILATFDLPASSALTHSAVLDLRVQPVTKLDFKHAAPHISAPCYTFLHQWRLVNEGHCRMCFVFFCFFSVHQPLGALPPRAARTRSGQECTAQDLLATQREQTADQLGLLATHRVYWPPSNYSWQH